MKKKYAILYFLIIAALQLSYSSSPCTISSNDCVQLIFRRGDTIQVEILQINPKEIKYKHCGRPNDPEIIILKKDVFQIKAADGFIIFSSTQPIKREQNNTNILSVLGFAIGLFSLLFPFAAIAGLILSIIGIIQIKKDKLKYNHLSYVLALLGIIFSGIILLLLGGLLLLLFLYYH